MAVALKHVRPDRRSARLVWTHVLPWKHITIHSTIQVGTEGLGLPCHNSRLLRPFAFATGRARSLFVRECGPARYSSGNAGQSRFCYRAGCTLLSISRNGPSRMVVLLPGGLGCNACLPIATSPQ
jgi:hypothetical protein